MDIVLKSTQHFPG